MRRHRLLAMIVMSMLALAASEPEAFAAARASSLRSGLRMPSEGLGGNGHAGCPFLRESSTNYAVQRPHRELASSNP